MAENKILFQGVAPFDLGTAQHGRAQSLNGGVEMTFFVMLPDHGQLPQPVRVRMSPSAARTVAEQLSDAVTKAETAKE